MLFRFGPQIGRKSTATSFSSVQPVPPNRRNVYTPSSSSTSLGTCLYYIFRLIFSTMDRASESGLEIEIATGPEIAIQPYPGKYNTISGSASQPYSSHTDTSVQPLRKSQSRFKNGWILAIIGFICLAVAIGAGLGTGLAAQHKSSPSK